MTTITITLPDTITANDVVNHAAAFYGYKEQVPNPDFNTDASRPEFIANPVTRAQFARRMIREDIRSLFIRNKSFSDKQVLADQRAAEDLAAERQLQDQFLPTTISVI